MLNARFGFQLSQCIVSLFINLGTVLRFKKAHVDVKRRGLLSLGCMFNASNSFA